MADRPSNTGREDTVALPRTPQPDGGGNGKVLPPMPDKPEAAAPAAPATPPATPANGTRNGSSSSSSSARPAQPRSPRPTTKKTPRPAAKKAAPAAARGAAAPAARPAQPSPATQSTPAARTSEPVPPAAAPPPVVAAPAPAPAPQVESGKPAKTKPVKPSKPTREEKRAAAAAAAPQAGRRARLRLTRVDPWSVMKTSFLLSIALGIVIVVSVLMVWTVLGAADVWSSINQTVQDVVGGQDASTFDIEDYLGTRRVVGFTMIVAAVDVVLVTAICTLGAFLYNMSASLLGGVEVTLAEDN